MRRRYLAYCVLALALTLGTSSTASADMLLSQVIVDLMPGKPPRDDIEVFNDGPDRMYVSAEPFEISGAGTPAEKRTRATDPENSGILVSPQKLILAPGERRIIRIAAVGQRSETDRVFRVAIKPVVGEITAGQSAIKVLVGYDALVLVRPEKYTGDLVARRSGQTLTILNAGNTSQELFDGKQCDETGTQCRSLAAKRLYPGTTLEQTLPFGTPVSYKTSIGPTVRDRRF